MSSVHFVIYVWAVYFNFCFVKTKTTTTELKMQIYGSIIENLGGLLFNIEADSLISAAQKCTSRCHSVRKCIGLEICKIASDRYRCRACCSWTNLGRQTSPDKPACKYYQMIREDDKEYHNVALNKPAELSTMWDPYHKPEYAVNNKLICPTGRYHLAHTKFQVDPWLEINLQSLFEIRYIVLYARQDCCEPGRTKNLELTVRDNAESHLCGIYPGLTTKTGDRILITCPLVKAQFVRILIRSQPGKTDVIQVCEMQVFGKPL